MTNTVLQLRRSLITLTSTLLLFAACRENSSDLPAVASQLTIQSGDNQVAPVGQPLPAQLTVRAADASNRPAAGAEIVWSIESDEASTTTVTTSTNSQGVSALGRAIGSKAGLYYTKASLKEIASASVRFTSYAQVGGAFKIISNGGDQQNDTVLSTFAPYRVRVVDYRDAPVAGVNVSWSVNIGGGSLGNATPTNSDGVAEIVQTVGRVAGQVAVQASIDGLVGSPIMFIGTARAARLKVLAQAGDGQLGRANVRLQFPYRGSTFDAHGNAAQSILSWAVTSGGGFLSPDQFGNVVHTLGPQDGPQTVKLTAYRGADSLNATFTATALSALVSVGIAAYYYYYDLPLFSPDSVVVSAGGMVGWDWSGCYYCSEHNVTFEDDPTQPVSSPSQIHGTHFRMFSGPPRKIRYRCTNHSTSFTNGMVGTVTVR